MNNSPLLLVLIIHAVVTNAIYAKWVMLHMHRVAVDDDWTGFRRYGPLSSMIFHFCILFFGELEVGSISLCLSWVSRSWTLYVKQY